MVKQRRAESDDMRLDYSLGLEFFLCLTLARRRKKSFSVSLSSLNFFFILITLMMIRFSERRSILRPLFFSLFPGRLKSKWLEAAL